MEESSSGSPAVAVITCKKRESLPGDALLVSKGRSRP